MPLPRRTLLFTGLAAALAGCAAKPASEPGTALTLSTTPDADFVALERKFGGRLGFYALDTGTGKTVQYRAAERFLMCSTHKVLAVGAILRLRQQQPGLLDRVIHYDQSQVLSYAPITSQHVADGMTVSALCDAALRVSDNTAVNLLIGLLGGPPAVTAFVHDLGETMTHLDRVEPDVNVGAPGDERDTTIPAYFAADLRKVTLGDGLDSAGRDLLVNWMKSATTGLDLVRAGVPKNWAAADKSGSGAQGEVNDVAVVWPPTGAPLVVTAFTVPTDPKSTAGRATIAEATAIAVKQLGR
ncbi:class A beta-lactamase [Kutzneria sp. CA-103260]|uniref:class A beta-lactamase n=1 Tax=Kutzneria sp. CA-103260 TaxID=2802641 RepID=UPI001BACFF2A|nr:class A beta-lactamase [Kutzneria sp. CA-103260]QUQ63483.1 class A beta-lactamase [Kutzneria sp. CA-103260]